MTPKSGPGAVDVLVVVFGLTVIYLLGWLTLAGWAWLRRGR